MTKIKDRDIYMSMGLFVGVAIVFAFIGAYILMMNNIFFYQSSYQFSKNDICPCSSGSMVFSKECNEKIDKLLETYSEVKFCKADKI